jgi:hypothetical protein
MKTIFDVAFPILRRRCQFAHHNDQIFLRGQDLVGKELFL